MTDDPPSVSAGSPAPAEASTASLVNDIIGDVQSLVAQQIRLTGQEIAVNLGRRRSAAAIVTAGAGLGALGALLLCLSLVHGLHWLTAPAGIEAARLPLWACYAIVAVILGAVSGGLISLGRKMFRSIPPWQHLADHMFQENMPWTIPPR